VTNVHIVGRGTLRVTVGHPPIHLEISSREEGGLYATATIEADPPDEVAEAIRAVAGGGDPELLRSDAAITYANELGRTLHGEIDRSIGALSWAQGVPTRRSASLGMHVSVDGGATWTRYDGALHLRMAVLPGLALADDRAKVPLRLIEAGATRPVAHDLLAEASAVSASEPRSALVIAVAAVEVGFKSLVAQLVPDAAWLVEHVPSPPLAQMLRDYLPDLPVKGRLVFNGVEQTGGTHLPTQVLTTIRQAVEKRNGIAHRGVERIDPGWVADFVDLCSDLLYLFDCHAGHAWAVANLSKEFAELLAKGAA
jgi:hypothetical protein